MNTHDDHINAVLDDPEAEYRFYAYDGPDDTGSTVQKSTVTTKPAHDFVAGDVVLNRGVVMSTEHWTGLPDPTVTLWFRNDGTDGITSDLADLTSWSLTAYHMVWWCKPEGT